MLRQIELFPKILNTRYLKGTNAPVIPFKNILHISLFLTLSLSVPLFLSLSLSSEKGVCTLSPVRERAEREREKKREKERELHARPSRKCGHAESLSVPHSFSQSACVIIISIRLMPQLDGIHFVYLNWIEFVQLQVCQYYNQTNWGWSSPIQPNSGILIESTLVSKARIASMYSRKSQVNVLLYFLIVYFQHQIGNERHPLLCFFN